MIKTLETIVIRIVKVCPKTSGDWRPSFLWSFMEHKKLVVSTKWEDKFAKSVLNSWKDVPLDLVKRLPKIEVEFYRQPLI